MDITTALVAVISTYFIIVVTKWAINRRRSHGLFRKYNIPGPTPSFLGGNMFQLRVTQTPNETITKWIKEYGNVFGYFIGGSPQVIVNDLDMIKQITVKDFHVFTNRPPMSLDVSPLNKTLLYLRDVRWKEIRSIMTPTFSSAKIRLIMTVIDKKADITVEVVSEHARKNEAFDIYELMQGLTLDVIADCALAMKTDCQRDLKDMFIIAVRDFFRYSNSPPVIAAILFPFIASIMTFINNYLTAGQMTELIIKHVKRAIVERRKEGLKGKSVDILQLMLDAGGDDPKGGMTDDEILANAYIFLLAGYETTSTALGFTFYLLITHPDVQEKLFQEIDSAPDFSYSTIQDLQYLDQVFSESLRLYPPVTGFISRQCDEDYPIGNFTIPKGAIVQAPVWDIHHSPDYWPDPWTFDPDRFAPENRKNMNPMSYMPFGLGRRNCIGARFAQLEAKLAIFKLIKRFKFETCDQTDHPPTLICPTVTINPAKGVFVKVIERVG